MNYIINPAWFYFMSVSDGLVVIAIISATVFGLICGAMVIQISDSFGEEERKAKRTFKKSLVFLLISVLFAVLVPSKNTILQIMIAKYATYDNAATVIQTVQNAADYIIESVGKLK